MLQYTYKKEVRFQEFISHCNPSVLQIGAMVTGKINDSSETKDREVKAFMQQVVLENTETPAVPTQQFTCLFQVTS